MRFELLLPGALTLGLVAFPAHATELSVALGATGQGDTTIRTALALEWNKHWWQSATGRLGGYWDTAYTYWDGGDEASAAHSLSFSPVLTYEFAGFRYTPYVEAGIGVALFSKTDVGEQQLGSSFNFEDRLGLGLRLPGERTLGLRAMHYSNAGLKQPNDGIESYSLFYSQAF